MTIKQGTKQTNFSTTHWQCCKYKLWNPWICITHKWIGEKDKETLKTGIPESLFKEKEPDCLGQARHKELCNDIGGGIMFCQDCKQTIFTTEIVKQSLKRWNNTVIQSARAQDKRPHTNIPLSPERLDMATYTFSYHINGGCALDSDPFGGYNNTHKTLLKYKFENTQPVIVHRVSKRAASVGFFFHSCQLLLHTFMRIEVTKTKIKLCGFVWMDQSTVCIHLWLSPNNPWAIRS